MRRLIWALIALTTVASSTAQAITITGRVVGPDGRPVAGVSFGPAALKANRGVLGQTDRQGRFSLKLAKAQLLSVSAPGFVPVDVTPRSGENTLRLDYAGQAWGSVVDTKGRPVSGAKVSLIGVVAPDGRATYYSWRGRSEYTYETTPDGRWTIPIVPTAGKAMVMLSDPRFVSTWTEALLGVDAVAATPLVARPGGKIIGRVIAKGGRPVTGALVIARGPNGECSTADVRKDGTYTLTGLDTGIYAVSAEDPTQILLQDQTNVEARAGQVSRMRDLVLEEGAIVDGLVIDKKSRQPRAGMHVLVSNSSEEPSRISAASANTDATGHFRLGVGPGKVHVTVMNSWEDQNCVFIMPRPEPATEITLARGERRKVVIALEPAISLTGTAVQPNGKPAVDAMIVASMAGIYPNNKQYPAEIGVARTDTAGRFTIPNLIPGTATLATEHQGRTGDWELAEPTQIKLPVAQPVKIVLNPTLQKKVSGRIVTPSGQPVPGARISATIKTPASDKKPYISVREDQTTTDIGGRFTIPRVLPGDEVELAAQKPGYQFASGGSVRREGEEFVVEDLVMLPLSAKLEGRVLDASGSPVAGASIAWPEGGDASITLADNQGHFELAQIPEGDLKILAAGGKSSAWTTLKAPATGVEIRLAAPNAAAAKGERAFAIMQEFMTAVGGKDSECPTQMAMIDPDLGMKLAAKCSPGTMDEILAGTIAGLARTNPEKAAAWAPTKLDSIKKPRLQLYAATALGIAVANTHPDLARGLYERAKPLAESKTDTQGLVNNYASLAALAARLGDPEARAMFEKAMKVPGYEKDFYAPVLLARVVAQGNVEMAQEAAQDAENSYKEWAFREAIQEIASRDIKGACWLLVRLQETGANKENDSDYGPAAVAVVRYLRKADPAAALEIARGIKDTRYQPLALALAGAMFSGKDAEKIFREAAESASGRNIEGAHRLAFVAGQAYQKDPALGRELFELARATNKRTNLRRDEIAEFAFYYRWANPAESRIMLEQEFSKLQKMHDEERFQALSHVAEAMDAIDPERALEMTKALTISPSSWYRTPCTIAMDLFADETTLRESEFGMNPFYNGIHYRPLPQTIWTWNQ